MNWQKKLFDISIVTCMGFLLLTLAAMAVYPGGTIQNHSQPHYQFFGQPFSDLGRTRVFDSRPNTISMVLFMLAMLGGGIGLAGFFVGFAGLMQRTWPTRLLSIGGAIFGIIAAGCFIGVACTPWDLYMKLHIAFVLSAFRCLLVATVLDLIAVFFERRWRSLIGPFAVFICILAGYIVLLTAGLSGGRADNPVLQATGQKVVVYAAIMMVLTQSLLMRRSDKSVAF
jgi:MFS family permease